MKYLVAIVLCAALAGCSGNVSGLPAPTHWRSFHGVPIAVVGGSPVLDAGTLTALELAGVDTSNRTNLRAVILREAR